MAVQLLFSVRLPDNGALRAFHALRESCRAAVRRDLALGCALLFTGSRTVLLLEGDERTVATLMSALQVHCLGAALQVWRLTLGPDDMRFTQPGQCRSGYLSADDAEAELDGGADIQKGPAMPIDGPAAELPASPAQAQAQAQIGAFARWFAASDHD